MKSPCVLNIRHPRRFAPERKYILDVLFGESLGVQYVTTESEQGYVSIGLVDASSEPSTQKEIRVADVFFRTPEEHWLTRSSLPALTFDGCRAEEAEWLGMSTPDSIPVLFGRRLPNNRYFSEDAQGIKDGPHGFSSTLLAADFCNVVRTPLTPLSPCGTRCSSPGGRHRTFDA